MGSHPLNLFLRFILEISTLAATSYWGWTQHEGFSRWLWMIFSPLIIAFVWGTFTVKIDPSRSGKAPVQVSGALRLILEIAIFTSGSIALFASHQNILGMIFSGAAVFHYLISYDRILWLLKN